MPQNVQLFDTATGRPKNSGHTVRALQPTPQDFDVGEGGVVEVTVGTLTATQPLTVKLNGREVREGGGHDFTRDIDNGKVLFNYTVPQNTWIRVRRFPE